MLTVAIVLLHYVHSYTLLKFMNLILVEEDCCIPVQQSDSQGQSLALVIDSLIHALS